MRTFIVQLETLDGKTTRQFIADSFSECENLIINNIETIDFRIVGSTINL